jgi:hypothetical protein
MQLGEVLGWVTTILEQTGLMVFLQAIVVMYIVVAFFRRLFDR